MKKIVLASIIGAAVLGAASVHGYFWLSSLVIDAERMRDIDDAFDEITDIFWEEDAEEDLDS
jgi:hypothetical protein